MFKFLKTLKQAWNADKEKTEQDRAAQYALNKTMSDAVQGVFAAVTDAQQVRTLGESGQWQSAITPDYKDAIKDILADAHSALTAAYAQTQTGAQKLSPSLQGIAALVPSIENSLESMEGFATRAKAIQQQQKKAFPTRGL